ncbi:hypothetical protein [Thalassobacillus hwangdonensis]|uniref:Uncharacterized protein n=1 Tax=Thalassobacillus hwangdonensis TaxID=546108 RepID=A0ABW3L4E5_9BACI
MKDMAQLLEQDGRKQLIIGIISALIGALFIFGLFVVEVDGVSYLVTGFFIFIFLFIGLTQLSAGARDLRQSRSGTKNFTDGVESVAHESLPKRMYLGFHSGFDTRTRLYDMDGNTYGEVKEQGRLNRAVKFLGGAVHATPFLPGTYAFYDQDANLIYSLDKKGGLRWRSYIEDESGHPIAYIEEPSGNKGKVLHYLKGDQLIWKAETDSYGDFVKIYDTSGKMLVEMKRDAIPVEAVDRFGSSSGFLLEWHDAKDVTDELLVFTFTLHLRRFMNY